MIHYYRETISAYNSPHSILSAQIQNKPVWHYEVCLIRSKTKKGFSSHTIAMHKPAKTLNKYLYEDTTSPG